MTHETESDAETHEQEDHDPKVMTLFQHLDELRGRLVRSIASCLIFFVLAMVFWKPIFEFLKIPLLQAIPDAKLHFTDPMDPFITSIKVGFFSSLIAACPVWLYQFWRFIEPALYPEERKYILPFTFASVALFFAGVSFSFFFIYPLAIEFLLNYGENLGVEPIITISRYMSMLSLMVFGFGIVFETPLILVLLGMLDIVNADSLAKHRQIVLVLIVIVGALLTPPDPLSQLGMAVPLYLMYEISIVIIRVLKRKPKEENDSNSLATK